MVPTRISAVACLITPLLAFCTATKKARAGGTLFLDEVGDIPLGIQIKLLRLLETGAYRRVGSSEPRRADIRLISATHRPLDKMVRAGLFRQDLYDRINTFSIAVPPLWERSKDLPLLIDTLLRRIVPARPLHLPAALSHLDHYPFPGQCAGTAQPPGTGQHPLRWGTHQSAPSHPEGGIDGR
jgi:DNA-binding NtrC family response regulator